MIALIPKNISALLKESKSIGKSGMALAAVCVVFAVCLSMKSSLSKVGVINKLKEFIAKIRDWRSSKGGQDLDAEGQGLEEEYVFVHEPQFEGDYTSRGGSYSSYTSSDSEEERPPSIIDNAGSYRRSSGASSGRVGETVTHSKPTSLTKSLTFPTTDPSFMEAVRKATQRAYFDMTTPPLKQEYYSYKPSNSDVFTFDVNGQAFEMLCREGHVASQACARESRDQGDAVRYIIRETLHNVRVVDKLVVREDNAGKKDVSIVIKERPDMKTSNSIRHEIRKNPKLGEKAAIDLTKLASKYIFTVPDAMLYHNGMIGKLNAAYSKFTSGNTASMSDFGAKSVLGPDFFTFTRNRSGEVEVNVSSVQDTVKDPAGTVPGRPAVLCNYAMVCSVFPENVDSIIDAMPKQYNITSEEEGFLRSVAANNA